MEVTTATATPALLTSYERWWRTTGHSMTTVENYCYALERFAATLWALDHDGDEPQTPRALDRALVRAGRRDIVEYLAVRLEAGVAASTVSNDTKAVRSFYAWLHAEGDIDTNPAEGVKGPKVAETPVREADEAQYKALLRTCRPGTLNDRRDAAIIAMLWHGGFRRGELVTPDLEHVDLDGGTLVVPKTKSGRPRLVRLHPEVVSLLDRYLRMRGDDAGPLLLSYRRSRLTSNGIGQMMQRRCEAADVTINAHAFRRAFAVRWREADGSMSGLMAHAGWKSEAMVRKYTRMSAERLAGVEYDRLFGRQ